MALIEKAWDRPYTERGSFRLPFPMITFRDHYGDGIMECLCGCKEEVKEGNRFIHGHNGRCISDETRAKLSESHKKPNSGQFKKGHISWVTGKKLPEDEYPTMGMRGKKHSEESKRKMALTKTGKEMGDRTKLKMSIAHIKPRTDGYCTPWSIYLFKKAIRGDACEYCGITNNMNLKLFGESLNIHHIDAIKLNCNPDNLATLCSSCHGKADHGVIAL